MNYCTNTLCGHWGKMTSTADYDMGVQASKQCPLQSHFECMSEVMIGWAIVPRHLEVQHRKHDMARQHDTVSLPYIS